MFPNLLGKPKGLAHSTAGYLTYAGFTQKQAFSYFDTNDIFGCVADIGWITGKKLSVFFTFLFKTLKFCRALLCGLWSPYEWRNFSFV